MVRRVPCVGAIMTDPDGRLLLIKRGHAPGAGLWSVPGGRVEDGESDAEAVVREVREETGLIVAPGALVGAVERPGAEPGTVYEIRDYRAEVTGGVLAAGDDAADARWVTPGELRGLSLTPGLVDALTEWGVLPGGVDGA
jgi:8-oxo-dGTP diphosphatase